MTKGYIKDFLFLSINEDEIKRYLLNESAWCYKIEKFAIEYVYRSFAPRELYIRMALEKVEPVNKIVLEIKGALETYQRIENISDTSPLWKLYLAIDKAWKEKHNEDNAE